MHDPVGSALARAELGYVDFLRARYDRAELWLSEALSLAEGSPAVMARAATYLGSVHSDTADYPRAIALLDLAVDLSREADDPRRQAYALCMRGRVDLLRGDPDEADRRLADAITLAERAHWLSFLPWPQAFQGEACLARQDPSRAAEIFQQAFARACQLGDPCWEGITARGLALVADARGDTEGAFATMQDARVRSARDSRIPTSGSTHTSSTRCAGSAGRTTIPTPGRGSTSWASWQPGPACGSSPRAPSSTRPPWAVRGTGRRQPSSSTRSTTLRSARWRRGTSRLLRMNPCRVLVLGATASGVTTLGRALAARWSVPHADTDDYFWEPTEPPYTVKRAEERRIELMQEMFLPRRAWVLTGSVMGWGEPLLDHVDVLVFCSLDPDVRLERLRAREAVRYGDRIRPAETWPPPTRTS